MNQPNRSPLYFAVFFYLSFWLCFFCVTKPKTYYFAIFHYSSVHVCSRRSNGWLILGFIWMFILHEISSRTVILDFQIGYYSNQLHRRFQGSFPYTGIILNQWYSTKPILFKTSLRILWITLTCSNVFSPNFPYLIHVYVC